MTPKRLDFVLPLVTLVVSFVGVFLLGHVFATGGNVPPGPAPDSGATQTSPVQPPSEPPSSAPTVSGTHIELVIQDLSVDDPAPGLLRIVPPVGVSDRRICLTDAVRSAWMPKDAENWTDSGDALCWAPVGKSSNGELVIVLERK